MVELCDGKVDGKVYAIWENNPQPTGFPDFYDVRISGVRRKRLTCPKCKRRIMSSVRLCHDGCHIIHELVPHKPKGWWKKKKKKRSKK